MSIDATTQTRRDAYAAEMRHYSPGLLLWLGAAKPPVDADMDDVFDLRDAAGDVLIGRVRLKFVWSLAIKQLL